MGLFHKLFGAKSAPQPDLPPEDPERRAERLTALAANDRQDCRYRIEAVREIASERPPDAVARLIAVYREGSHPFDLSRALEESINAIDPRALNEHRKRSSELASTDRDLLDELRGCGEPDVLNLDEKLEQAGQRLLAAGGRGSFTLAYHIEQLIPRRTREILPSLYLARHAEHNFDLEATLKSLRYTAQYKAGRFAHPNAELVSADRYGWSDETFRRVRELTEAALPAGR